MTGKYDDFENDDEIVYSDDAAGDRRGASKGHSDARRRIELLKEEKEIERLLNNEIDDWDDDLYDNSYDSSYDGYNEDLY